MYLRVRVEYLALFSASFASLMVSQVASALSNMVIEPKLSLTLFTLSSSLASGGFLIMLFSILSSGKEEAFALLPSLPILVSLPDVSAFLLSLIVAALTHGGHLRGYLVVLSLTHLARGLSSLLMPMGVGVHLLLISEASKTLATLLFAIYHLGKVIRL